MPLLSENRTIESPRVLASGVSDTGFTRQMNSKRRTIIILQQCYNVTGTILDHLRAGRPKGPTV